MDVDKVDKIVSAFDVLCEAAGQPKLTSLFKQFSDVIPTDMHEIALAQIKTSIAEAFETTLQQQTAEMSKLMTDPEMLEKIKKMRESNEEVKV